MATKKTTDEGAEETSGPISFADGIKQCAALLADVPDALDFSVKKDDNERHYQSFDNLSQEAAQVREKIAVILREIYDNGMYNFAQLAAPLRVESKSILALLDEDFRAENHLA